MSTALLILATTVTFAGQMPPHLASDGRLYTAAGTQAASLRACGIRDFEGRDGRFKFAVGPDGGDKVSCLQDRSATIEPRTSWND